MREEGPARDIVQRSARYLAVAALAHAIEAIDVDYLVIEGFRGVAARPELEAVAIRRREPGDVRYPVAVPVPLMIPAAG